MLHQTNLSLLNYTVQMFIKQNNWRLNLMDSDFLMSHQISIWNKKFLYAQLKNIEHPWRNERRGSKRQKKGKDEIYQIDLISENEE